ncbi:MAG: PspC domain-containing protein [Bdellovibrionales bacterium]|nr:PspC domain-containing protein [Bdellovibrionales bacterium]
MKTVSIEQPWVRSRNGWILGVCEGIGRRFDMAPGVVRLLWLLSVLFLGFGFFFYFIVGISLPVEGKEHLAYQPRILGVCARLARALNFDVGLTRVLAVVIALGSLGTTLLAYIILHFLVPNIEEKQIPQKQV